MKVAPQKARSRACIPAAIFALAVARLAPGAEPTLLSEREYKDHGSSQGVVLLHVNWGRKWKCGGFENAQLESITFARRSGDGASTGTTTLELPTSSKLLADDAFKPYAILVTPGEYILSGYDLKTARSVSDIAHIRAEESQLVRNGEPVGGAFSVAPGEVVYIGHIGLDCAHDPIPWRYYIEGKEEFDGYVAGFRKRFPFIGNTPVVYRLLTTKLFGEAYSLD